MSVYIGITARVDDSVVLENDASVCDKAQVTNKSRVYGCAQVGGNSHVCNSLLEGDVTISDGWILNTHWWRDVP